MTSIRVFYPGGLVLLTMLSIGCVSPYYTRPGTLKPAIATVSREERTLAWQHAVTGLLDHGYVPQVLSESAGYISARRREDIVADALTGTMATVVISPEGAVRVEVTGTGLYHSEQEFLQAVTARQNEIMQAILAAHAQAK
jgi:hypothetical protein